jgi:ATP-dependent exoDNAse (exonuclease V) beta subunit
MILTPSPISTPSSQTIHDLCDLISQKERIGRFLLQEALGDLSLSEDVVPPVVPSKPASSVPSMFPVRLLTMHRAKGNEFDDVYLSGWEEGVFPASGKSVAEERRLAYVALTRSRQRVMVTYAGRRRTIESGGKVVAMQPSRFLSELRERNNAVKTESKAFYPGMATQVGAGWIERWPVQNTSVRQQAVRQVEVEVAENIDAGRRRRSEEPTEPTSPSPPSSEEADPVESDPVEVDTFKYKTQRAKKEAAAITLLLKSLSKGSLKATPAKAMFKAKLANMGITRGSGKVTDKNGETVTRSLSKMTGKQLGEYLLEQVRTN